MWSSADPIERAYSNLSIAVPWIKAGQINSPGLSVNPEFGQYENGEYYLLPSSWVDRGNATADVFVPSSSQFYAKTYDHEQVHVAQFAPGGMFELTFSAAETYNRIMNAHLSAPDIDTLMTQVTAVVLIYWAEQAQVVLANKAQAEAEAYAVADAVDPEYLYQGYCPGHPDF